MTLTAAERDYLATQPLGRLVSRNPWTVRGVEIRGHAEALVDEEPTSSHTSTEIIRIHPQRVISWGIDPEPGMHGRNIDSAPAGGPPPLG